MLKPRKRITKKKLKEDKLVTFYFRASDWLEENSKYLFMGLAAIVLVAAAIIYFNYAQEKSEKNASVDLARATRTLETGDYQNAIAQLSSIVDNYGSSTSGTMARLYLANALFQTKEYNNAEKNYAKFISRFSGDEYLLAAAQGGIAASLQARKKWAEAAKAYEKAAEKYDSVLAPGFYIQAARCYTSLGDDRKAKSLYNKVIEEFPQATEKEEALMLLSMLGA